LGRWCIGLGLFIGLLTWSLVVQAQEIVAPRVKSLPGIEVPSGVEVPESGIVRVRVRIGADGTGVVETCDAGRVVCDLVIRAIADAEFEPATRDGNPVPSEVQVELRIRHAPQDNAQVATMLEPAPPQVEKELVFSETAEVDARAQERIKLELAGIRNIPGTLGEPFRTLALMPCTVPIVNGQPYVYVCGAPPSGTLYVYDDIPVPLLFHSGLGPATIQSGLIGSIDLYTSAPPARYGRLVGGAMAGNARKIPNDRVHGEAQLRAIDVSGMLNTPMPKEGSMTFAGRYGFPNLVLDAIGVDASFKYWDYQYRTGVAMSARSRFEVVAFGGRDESVVDSKSDERLDLDLQFHRFEARFIGKVERWSLIGALLYGYDYSLVQNESGTVSNSSANINRFGSRFLAIYRAPKVRVRLGGDAAGLFGPADCTPLDTSDQFSTIPNLVTPCDPQIAQQSRRAIGGAFVDTVLSPVSWLDLSLGIRTDVWKAGSYRAASVKPRARATFHAGDMVDLFVGWGLGARPATFAIPLPGLGEIPLEAGLQHANQTEGGIRLFLPHEITFETRGYVSLYRDLRFVDIFTDYEISADPASNQLRAGVLNDAADGKSYGFQLLLQRPFDVGISTLVSYTLGFNDLTASAILFDGSSQSFDYTPSYDVRHVMNGVLSWESKFGLILAAHVLARSGRAEGWLWLDPAGVVQQYVQRVPWFVRLDAQVAYEWAKPGRRMRISLEWLNVTQARDAQEVDSEDTGAPFLCRVRWGVPLEPCPIKYTTAIWFPNLAFRAVF
jgi:hypothetical protein